MDARCSDRDDGDESIEEVELGRVDLLHVHQRDPEPGLHEDGDLDRDREPPEGASPQARPPVRAERPQSCETVADDDEPGPPAVDLEKDERAEESCCDVWNLEVQAPPTAAACMACASA